MKSMVILCLLLLNVASFQALSAADKMTQAGATAAGKTLEEVTGQVKHEDVKARKEEAKRPGSEMEHETKEQVNQKEKGETVKTAVEVPVDEAKGEIGEQKEEEEEEHEAPSGIRDPRPCEVCKYLAVELQGRLEETGKVKEFIETGHGIMPEDRKRKEYKKSELRFIEAVHEPHVCDKLLEYDIHAERKKSLRYAKGHSETRRTLHWLRMKGVHVELGMPEEVWTRNAPPNEIMHLQHLCIEMVGQYEEDIEDWYWGYQQEPLYDYLCRQRALSGKDQECLKEEFIAEEHKHEESDGANTDGQLPDASETKGDPGSVRKAPSAPSSVDSETAGSDKASPSSSSSSSNTGSAKDEL